MRSAPHAVRQPAAVLGRRHAPAPPCPPSSPVSPQTTEQQQQQQQQRLSQQGHVGLCMMLLAYCCANHIPTSPLDYTSASLANGFSSFRFGRATGGSDLPHVARAARPGPLLADGADVADDTDAAPAAAPAAPVPEDAGTSAFDGAHRSAEDADDDVTDEDVEDAMEIDDADADAVVSAPHGDNDDADDHLEIEDDAADGCGADGPAAASIGADAEVAEDAELPAGPTSSPATAAPSSAASSQPPAPASAAVGSAPSASHFADAMPRASGPGAKTLRDVPSDAMEKVLSYMSVPQVEEVRRATAGVVPIVGLAAAALYSRPLANEPVYFVPGHSYRTLPAPMAVPRKAAVPFVWRCLRCDAYSHNHQYCQCCGTPIAVSACRVFVGQVRKQHSAAALSAVIRALCPHVVVHHIESHTNAQGFEKGAGFVYVDSVADCNALLELNKRVFFDVTDQGVEGFWYRGDSGDLLRRKFAEFAAARKEQTRRRHFPLPAQPLTAELAKDSMLRHQRSLNDAAASYVPAGNGWYAPASPPEVPPHGQRHQHGYHWLYQQQYQPQRHQHTPYHQYPPYGQGAHADAEAEPLPW